MAPIASTICSKNFVASAFMSREPAAACAVALDAVKSQGFRVLDEQPRPGSRGTTVAFIHPKDALGTLIELVQE